MEILPKEEEGEVRKIPSYDSCTHDGAIAVKRAVTSTGVRVSIEIKQEGSQELEASTLKADTRVKEEVTVEGPDTRKQEEKPESKLPIFPESYEPKEGKSDGFKEKCVVKEVKKEPEDLEIKVKEEPDVCKAEVKLESNQPFFLSSPRGMPFKEYCEFTERKSNGGTQNGTVKEEPDVVVMEMPRVLFDRCSRRQNPKNVKQEMVEDTMINGIKVEDGDFPEEADWYLVGRTMVIGLSTSKGRKLVDNEIVNFVFPNTNMRFNSQWIVRFSTKRYGEVSSK